MVLESTLVPIPSETIIPPAAYLAHTQGEFSLTGIVLAGAANPSEVGLIEVIKHLARLRRGMQRTDPADVARDER